MLELIDKLPPLLQLAAFLGVMVAVATVWIVGRRSPSGDRGENAEHAAGAADQMVEQTRQIEELQARLLDARFKQLRADLEIVIGAVRQAVTTELNATAGDIYSKMNKIEGTVAALNSRINAISKSSGDT